MQCAEQLDSSQVRANPSVDAQAKENRVILGPIDRELVGVLGGRSVMIRCGERQQHLAACVHGSSVEVGGGDHLGNAARQSAPVVYPSNDRW